VRSRLRLGLILPFLALPLVLTGCGSSGSGGGSGAFPAVSGSYGQKPTLKFPSGKPSSTLQKKVLHQGDGATVAKGQLLVADYLGQIWKGKVFDNSYDRKQPAAFPIGVGKVIPGWDEALVGVKAGSRVLLVVPPAKGYGASGNPQAGITGKDTLVFVVDVVSAFGSDAAGDAHATPGQKPPAGITVNGALGQRATIAIAPGATPPSGATTTVLAKGNGAPVKEGLVVAQYAVADWTGKEAESTWADGQPAGLPVGAQGSSVISGLLGVPLGSRVLLTVPPQDATKAKTDTEVVVLDLIAQPPTAAEAARAR
jgi:peptidylprolyl isomerase